MFTSLEVDNSGTYVTHRERRIIPLALSTKMSQLGHYETIRILGICIENVVHEQNPVKMTLLTMFKMLELYFENPQRVFSLTN
jgi:hypothetical protein